MSIRRFNILSPLPEAKEEKEKMANLLKEQEKNELQKKTASTNELEQKPSMPDENASVESTTLPLGPSENQSERQTFNECVEAMKDLLSQTGASLAGSNVGGYKASEMWIIPSPGAEDECKKILYEQLGLKSGEDFRQEVVMPDQPPAFIVTVNQALAEKLKIALSEKLSLPASDEKKSAATATPQEELEDLLKKSDVNKEPWTPKLDAIEEGNEEEDKDDENLAQSGKVVEEEALSLSAPAQSNVKGGLPDEYHVLRKQEKELQEKIDFNQFTTNIEVRDYMQTFLRQNGFGRFTTNVELKGDTLTITSLLGQGDALEKVFQNINLKGAVLRNDIRGDYYRDRNGAFVADDFVIKLNPQNREHLIERLKAGLNKNAIPSQSEQLSQVIMPSSRGKITQPPQSRMLNANPPTLRAVDLAPAPASVTPIPTQFQPLSTVQEVMPNKVINQEAEDVKRGMVAYLSYIGGWETAKRSISLNENKMTITPTFGSRGKFENLLKGFDLIEGNKTENGDFYRNETGGFVINKFSKLKESISPFLPAQQVKMSAEDQLDFHQFLINKNQQLKDCKLERSDDGRQIKIADYAGSSKKMREFLGNLGLRMPDDFYEEKNRFAKNKFVINPDKLQRFRKDMELVRVQRCMQEYLRDHLGRKGGMDMFQDQVELNKNKLKIKPIRGTGEDFKKLLINRLNLTSADFLWKKNIGSRDEFEIDLNQERLKTILTTTLAGNMGNLRRDAVATPVLPLSVAVTSSRARIIERPAENTQTQPRISAPAGKMEITDYEISNNPDEAAVYLECEKADPGTKNKFVQDLNARGGQFKFEASVEEDGRIKLNSTQSPELDRRGRISNLQNALMLTSQNAQKPLDLKDFESRLNSNRRFGMRS